MKRTALVLDLDDTLYNWMDAFALSLDVQIAYIAKTTRLTKKRIQESFKKIFEIYRCVEVIDAVNELYIWSKIKFSSTKIDKIKKQSSKLFFQTFVDNLCLFPTVLETLKWANANQILIFAVSNAPNFWIHFRLEQLKIINFFEKIYVLEDDFNNVKKNVVTLPEFKIKPNTFALDEIRRDYHLNNENIYFVGDSKDKDIRTAKLAGVKSIWALYGKKHDKKSTYLLRAVTPWTKSQKLAKHRIVPQYTINEFAEIKSIIKL